MPPNQPNTIYPCAFSKRYGIPSDQAWLLLKIFFIYRFIIASLFVILFFSNFGPSLLGWYDSSLYSYTSVSYLLLSVISGLCVYRQILLYTAQAQIAIFSEIIFITLIMHASGGVGSGIGILLAISIAAGGLLVGGRCAMLFAALASLAILTEQIYAVLTHAFEMTTFTYSGMLGAAFFTIAFLSYVLAQRSEQSALLASQHAATIARLEEINRYIIQHLQSGIIVVDQQQRIEMFNEAALRFLNIAPPLKSLEHTPLLLQQAFKFWQTYPNEHFTLLPLPDGTLLHIHFSLVTTHSESDSAYMITLEDTAFYNQRVQQGKLASLGRLTASIAHEIRNPLGAISHAVQLLSEAHHLADEDKRLTQIIQTHCRRVDNIINDILNLSRRHPSKKERLDLASWLPGYLNELYDDLTCSADAFELILKSATLTAYIDPGHLKQILSNLCANALKYGHQRGEKIRIEVQDSEQHLDIHIIDNGVGIDNRTAQHLFEPFFTTSKSGSGLGLYICRELAELNQARLSYGLSVDQKTCFTLSFPHRDSTTIEI